MDKPVRVSYTDERLEAEIAVRRATLLDSMRRTRLIEAGKAANEADVDRWLLRVMVYPDLAACTSGELRAADGTTVVWPVDFETFIGLPDELGLKLQEAVYRVNPHWDPQASSGADDLKKKPV